MGYNLSIPVDQIFSDWLLDILPNGKMDLVIKLASILWCIWFFRNKLVWENKVVTAKVATDWSIKMVVDWQLAKTKSKKPGEGNCSTTCGARNVTWKQTCSFKF
ncbi:hypothetical protein POM88_018930 [Heracleum sosnowskyi]|uniref:Uncharacterized protein n=1 Tax=Heracleum sosnowskyi TaxID=360622 RepID=A0AAD8MZT9_9APIA|nr:hypothetical protein POM88_018930 [Heracleum sosnowskyi]